MKRNDIGRFGEHLAVERLQRLGYQLVARNWRCTAGELDAVMMDGDELVFVEVKVRSGRAFGAAEEAMGPAKLRRILDAAQWFISDHGSFDHSIWRIDLVAITIDDEMRVTQFRHIPNAGIVG